MKPILFLLLFSPLITTAQVNLNAGLVAYYPFNGNANDESGNKNNPSVVKVYFTTDRSGKPKSAAAFDGKSNYIRVPDNAGFHFRKGFSISAWVMVKGFYEGTCHGNRIIMKGSTDNNPYSSGNYVLTFDDNKYTNGGNCYNKNPDKKHQSFYAGHAAPVTNDYIIPGKWYLLTYTYDGTKTALYVDCKLQAAGSIRNSNYFNTEDLFFGKMDNDQYPYWFNGLLDEVRIYNRPLNTNEILALCDKKQTNAVVAVACTDLTIVPAKFNYTISDCETVAFKLNTTNTKDIKTVQWSFGDGTVSNKTSPVHVYKKAGNYKIKSIVTSKFNCTDTFTQQIKLAALNTDFVFSEEGSPGKIQFKAKDNTASYNWNMGDGNSNENKTLVNHSYTKSGLYTVQLFAHNNAGCHDTIMKSVNIVLPEPAATATVQADKPAIISPTQPDIQLEKRKNDIVRYITVENDSVTVSLYDNGIIDGDSITLIYNDEVIVTHQLLKGKPLTLSLKISKERSSNELVMYAENLGSIPPNTAYMIIMDGNTRHDLNVSSSKTSNGIVSFTLRK